MRIEDRQRGSGGWRRFQLMRVEAAAVPTTSNAPVFRNSRRFILVSPDSIFGSFAKLANPLNQRRHRLGLTLQIRIRRHRSAKSDRLPAVNYRLRDLLVADRPLPFLIMKIHRLGIQIVRARAVALPVIAMAYGAAIAKYGFRLSPRLARNGRRRCGRRYNVMPSVAGAKLLSVSPSAFACSQEITAAISADQGDNQPCSGPSVHPIRLPGGGTRQTDGSG